MKFKRYVKIILVLLFACYVLDGNAQRYKIVSDKFQVSNMDFHYRAIDSSTKTYNQNSVISIDSKDISVVHAKGVDRYAITQTRQTVHGLEMLAQDKQGNLHGFQLNLSNKVLLQVDFSRNKVIGYNLFECVKLN